MVPWWALIIAFLVGAGLMFGFYAKTKAELTELKTLANSRISSAVERVSKKL